MNGKHIIFASSKKYSKPVEAKIFANGVFKPYNHLQKCALLRRIAVRNNTISDEQFLDTKTAL